MPEIDIDVTDTEMSVLEILWEHPEGIPVREIVLKLYGRHEHSLHGGVKSFLDRLKADGHADDVWRALEGIKTMRILVVGDAIIDDYHYCMPMNKSPKANVMGLVVHYPHIHICR